VIAFHAWPAIFMRRERWQSGENRAFFKWNLCWGIDALLWCPLL
jgi:hypothetical protein